MTGGGPRSGEYAGTVLLPDGGTVPCAVVLEAEANRLTGSAIQLPFGGRLVLEQPLTLHKKDLEQEKQVTAGKLTVTLENTRPQSAIADFEAARMAEHIYLSTDGDVFYHTAAFTCVQRGEGGPQRYFASAAEAELYGCQRCPHCLSAEGQPIEQSPV